MPICPAHFQRCLARRASIRTRPSGSRSRTRPWALSRGPGRAFSRQHGWTCIHVDFLLLPAGLLKVPRSVWVAHRCFSVRSLGPETLTPAHVRWRPSGSATPASVAHRHLLQFFTFCLPFFYLSFHLSCLPFLFPFLFTFPFSFPVYLSFVLSFNLSFFHSFFLSSHVLYSACLCSTPLLLVILTLTFDFGLKPAKRNMTFDCRLQVTIRPKTNSNDFGCFGII